MSSWMNDVRVTGNRHLFPRTNCGSEDLSAGPSATETRTTTLEMPLSSMSELPMMYRGTLDNRVNALQGGTIATREASRTRCLPNCIMV